MVHSCILNLVISVSAVRVARFMNSGHGSISSSSFRMIRFSRSSPFDVLLATSSVECSLGSLVFIFCVSRRGVPMTSRSIFRCVRLNVVRICFVNVQDVHAYRIVGVIVASKSRSRECRG